MKVGLFFGTFDPLHIGHLSIIQYMKEFTDLDEVWVVVSKQNPLKGRNTQADAVRRFDKVRSKLKFAKRVKCIDVELKMPSPSFTIDTLNILSSRYKKHRFVLIMGADNLGTFSRWKDWRKILTGFKLYVYPRGAGRYSKLLRHPHVKLVNAPKVDISSTFIREGLSRGKDMSLLMA